MTAGRPRTTMTDEVKAKIVETVRLGMWPDRAAQMHGVNPGTMRKEKKRDEEFAATLKAAEAQAEDSVYSRIVRHMDDQWTACAWMLERRWPERWAKRELPASSGEVRELAAQLRAAANSAKLSVPEPPAKEQGS